MKIEEDIMSKNSFFIDTIELYFWTIIQLKPNTTIKFLFYLNLNSFYLFYSQGANQSES